MLMEERRQGTHFSQEEPSKHHINKDALIHRLAQYLTYGPVLSQAMHCKGTIKAGTKSALRSRELKKESVHSVAYGWGLGYSSFFLFIDHSPQPVSKTSLQSSVKNSLNTPPPSIPALNGKHNQAQKVTNPHPKKGKGQTHSCTPSWSMKVIITGTHKLTFLSLSNPS
jgi:hypothetical protein